MILLNFIYIPIHEVDIHYRFGQCIWQWPVYESDNKQCLHVTSQDVLTRNSTGSSEDKTLKIFELFINEREPRKLLRPRYNLYLKLLLVLILSSFWENEHIWGSIVLLFSIQRTTLAWAYMKDTSHSVATVYNYSELCLRLETADKMKYTLLPCTASKHCIRTLCPRWLYRQTCKGLKGWQW